MLKEILHSKANLATFAGIFCGIIGIFFSFISRTDLGIVMLILSGIFDAFDGPIAKRINKHKEKEYGIHLDTLADIISSGILTVCICMSLGFTDTINLLVYILFIICGVIRLAYYNVNSSNEKKFIGLPITTASIVLPLIYLINKENEPLFMISLTTLSILFVMNLKITKPSLLIKLFLLMLGILAIALVLLMTYNQL